MSKVFVIDTKLQTIKSNSSTGSFNLSTKNGLIQGISHKYCQHIRKKDGYNYAT